MSRCGIKDQKHLTVGIGKLLIAYAVYLCKLVHKIFLIMKSSCRVADDYVTVSCNTCLNGVIDDCGRICTLFMLYDINIRSLCPYIKLIYSGGTEGVGGT